jgi:site-specific recombinase XerD
MARKTRTLDETRNRYLKTIALSLRPHTVANSRSVIDGFIRYLRAEYPRVSSFAQVKRFHIEAWISYLGHQPLVRSTRRNRIIKLRVFFQKIQALGWKEAPGVDLFRRGDPPPEDRCLPRPFSDETDRRLEDELRQRGGFIHKGLLLLRNTGLRMQEFLDLRVDSLRKLPGGAGELHVPLGKLHSERVIPVSAETVEIFEELCELRGCPPPVADPETGKPTHFLIMRPTGKRFSRDAFRYHLEKIEKEARLKEHPTPHRMRHTFATAMLRAGMSLPALMKILGHRTIGMTLRYAEVTGLDVQRAYEKALDALEGRYAIPALPATRGKSGKSSSRQAILTQLNALATAMEAFRRDHAKPSQAKRLQRLVERLRRLTADFRGLVS